MHEFTPRHVQWARKHDWFAGLVPDGIRVRSVVVKGGLSVVTFATYNNYRDLRAAVGY